MRGLAECVKTRETSPLFLTVLLKMATVDGCSSSACLFEVSDDELCFLYSDENGALVGSISVITSTIPMERSSFGVLSNVAIIGLREMRQKR